MVRVNKALNGKENVEVDAQCEQRLRIRLHQVPMSTMRQYCDDTSDTALIENNEVAPDWDCYSFWSDSIVFNESSIANVIAALSQRWL